MIDTKHALLLDRAGGGAAVELVMGLLSTARRIDAECADFLAQHGLSEGRFAALLAIEAESRATPARIAERLAVTRATVTGLVDGLVGAGLVSRETDPADRRSLALVLTDPGEHLLAALLPQYSAWLGRLVAGIDGESIDAGSRLFAAIQRNAGTLG